MIFLFSIFLARPIDLIWSWICEIHHFRRLRIERVPPATTTASSPSLPHSLKTPLFTSSLESSPSASMSWISSSRRKKTIQRWIISNAYECIGFVNGCDWLDSFVRSFLFSLFLNLQFEVYFLVFCCAFFWLNNTLLSAEFDRRNFLKQLILYPILTYLYS